MIQEYWSMRIKNRDLITAILVVVINVAWIQIPNRPVIAGIIFALPLIFILPGYMLTQTLFRKRSPGQSLDSSSNLIARPSLNIEQPVGRADQIVLILALSLPTDVLLGF